MTYRLDRIETLILSLATAVALLAGVLGLFRPLGIVLAGGAAWLDFVLIRRLGAMVVARRPSLTRVVPLALAKSLIVLVIGAGALLVPATLVDGLSFAIGVSSLPLAIVLDAALPAPVGHV